MPWCGAAVPVGKWALGTRSRGPGQSEEGPASHPNTPALQAQGAKALWGEATKVSTLGSATYKLNGFEEVSLNLSKP